MTDIEEKIIDIGHEIFKGYGVDDSTAQILSILNFESNEISMEELAQRTGYSLASISLKIKNIEHFWGIKRIHKPGSRKTYLHMEKNLLDAFAIQIRNGFETELDIAKEKITPLIEEYGVHANTEEQKTKLQTYENYLLEINKFEELIHHIYDRIDHLKKKQV
ncbi:GbsR/MarR family transcriptional regulator [Methanococcoides methylutens]|uniref:GbsR/MarR family transcriptional regulator n=1 Tax=Methanococcoides methylutens TaxID=2226 RepID=UPI004043D4A2